jgi:very-short-patch-repair endonuclease
MPSDQYLVFGPHDPAKRERAREFRLHPTPAEKRLWKRLQKHQVAGLGFRRQQVIRGFIVDFYCHQARLAVEVDGATHEKQVGYDEERDRILAEAGVRVLRVPNEHVMANDDVVVAEIEEAAAASI